jgi:hypothetical protein
MVFLSHSKYEIFALFYQKLCLEVVDNQKLVFILGYKSIAHIAPLIDVS